MSITLVSLNCEGHRHLESRILPFLDRIKPDVVSLQEIFEDDVPLIQQQLGATFAQFGPMALVRVPNKHMEPRGICGVAQFSTLPVTAHGVEVYVELAKPVPEFDGTDSNCLNRVLSWLTVEAQGQPYTVATTHFTWSPEGSFTERQNQELALLKQKLSHFPELIFSGDFNSPRQGDPHNVFNQLAQLYRDNMPVGATTSLDPQLHKAGPLAFLVDGLFTTPEYQVKSVELVENVSDHLAVVAEIERTAAAN